MGNTGSRGKIARLHRLLEGRAEDGRRGLEGLVRGLSEGERSLVVNGRREVGQAGEERSHGLVGQCSSAYRGRAVGSGDSGAVARPWCRSERYE